MTSWRDVIKVHLAAELFPRMRPDELRELGEDIKANGMKMPIILLHRQRGFSLLDGRNRLDALEAVGFDVPALFEACVEGKPRPELCVQYVAEPGVDCRLSDRTADPYEYVISANIRRRHLTAAQKSDLIAALLKANPERSDRATAAIANVDHKTVAAKRETLEATGEIPQLDKRTGADGRARSRPTHAATPYGATATSAEFEDIGPPVDPVPTQNYPLGQTGAEAISEAPMTVGSFDAAPAAAPPDETGESAPPDETGGSPQLTGDALVSAELANGLEIAALPVAPTRPDFSTRARICEAMIEEELPLDRIKRLIRQLPADLFEELKVWFREYASAVTVSGSGPEAISTKRGRGRPKGSTIANGARPPIHKPQEARRTAAPRTAPEGEQMTLTGIIADDQPTQH